MEHKSHFTGGSSSGFGAAVAAGFVLGSAAGDTGGSIRSPAAASLPLSCGIIYSLRHSANKLWDPGEMPPSRGLRRGMTPAVFAAG
jgi:Amidase